MSLTVDRPVEPTPGEPPRALARAEGLELLGDVSGSGYKDDVALVRRADGQMVQLGPLQYALLDAIDGERDLPALAAAASEQLGPRAAGRARRQDRREARRAGPARRHRGERAGALEPAARAALEGPVHRSQGDRAHHRAVQVAVPPVDRAPGARRVRRRPLVRADPRGRRARDGPGVRQARAAAARPRPHGRVGGLPRDRARGRVPVRGWSARRHGRRHLRRMARLLHGRDRRLSAATRLPPAHGSGRHLLQRASSRCSRSASGSRPAWTCCCC